jgi:hypothetical protein
MQRNRTRTHYPNKILKCHLIRKEKNKKSKSKKIANKKSSKNDKKCYKSSKGNGKGAFLTLTNLETIRVNQAID